MINSSLGYKIVCNGSNGEKNIRFPEKSETLLLYFMIKLLRWTRSTADISLLWADQLLFSFLSLFVAVFHFWKTKSSSQTETLARLQKYRAASHVYCCLVFLCWHTGFNAEVPPLCCQHFQLLQAVHLVFYHFIFSPRTQWRDSPCHISPRLALRREAFASHMNIWRVGEYIWNAETKSTYDTIRTL